MPKQRSTHCTRLLNALKPMLMPSVNPHSAKRQSARLKTKGANLFLLSGFLVEAATRPIKPPAGQAGRFIQSTKTDQYPCLLNIPLYPVEPHRLPNETTLAALESPAQL